MKWTKQLLASSINQRVDQNEIPGKDFVMVADITDKMVEHFQMRWDKFVSGNPAVGKHEFVRLYEAIQEEWDEKAK